MSRNKSFYNKLLPGIPIVLLNRTDEMYSFIDKKLKQDDSGDFRNGWNDTHAILMTIPTLEQQFLFIDWDIIKQLFGQRCEDALHYIIAHESGHKKYDSEKKADQYAIQLLQQFDLKRSLEIAIAEFRYRYNEEPIVQNTGQNDIRNKEEIPESFF